MTRHFAHGRSIRCSDRLFYSFKLVSSFSVYVLAFTFFAYVVIGTSLALVADPFNLLIATIASNTRVNYWSSRLIKRILTLKKFVNSLFKRNGRWVTFPDNSAGGINQDAVRDTSSTKVCLCCALAISDMVMLDLGPGLFGDTSLESIESLVRSETYDSDFISPVFLSLG